MGLQSIGSQRVGYDSDLAHTHTCITMMEFCYNEYSSDSQTGTLLVFCCKIKIFIKSLFADRNNPVGVEKLTMKRVLQKGES